MKSRTRLLLAAIGIAVSGFIVSSWLAADYLIGPMPSKVKWPAKLVYKPDVLEFSTVDGIKLKAWFLPQANCTSAIVLLHGVRANRDSMLARAEWLHSLGYNVFLYDARGCGESEEVVRTFGYHETRDLLGALTWLKNRGMTEIACIGCSQGAATILLASDRLPDSVRAVVAEAPYATLRNTTDAHFRAYTALPSAYFGALVVPIAEKQLGFQMDDVSPLKEIPKLKAPLFIIGGTSDSMAPPADIHRLYDAAVCDKSLWMIDWAAHADFFSYAENQYVERVGTFLKSHFSISH